MSSANTLTRHIVWTRYWPKQRDWRHGFQNSGTYAYRLKLYFHWTNLGLIPFRFDAVIITHKVVFFNSLCVSVEAESDWSKKRR